MDHDMDRIPDDLRQVGDRLRSDRPRLSPMELDRIKLRLMAQAAADRSRPRTRKGDLLKSRLAITVMLVLGLLFSTTGAGLAVSGLADDGSAGKAQYVAPGQEGGEELGEESEGVGEESAGDEAGARARAGEQAAATADGGDGLPFTGLAAIPLLLAGTALMITGFTLRRRSR
jgi:hypothetical protein